MAGVNTLLILPCVFFFALLHEYGHCFAAQKYDFHVHEVKLWFLGGQALVSNLEVASPKEEAVIAFAGPLVNFILAGIATALFYAGVTHPFMAFVVSINLVLGLFNLIPSFPMDGGRILRSFLSYVLGDRIKATKISAIVGLAISAFFITVGVLSASFMLIMIFAWIGMICYSLISNPDIIV